MRCDRFGNDLRRIHNQSEFSTTNSPVWHDTCTVGVNPLCPMQKMKLVMAVEVIKRLDIAQESRALSDAELTLRRGLKRRVMGLAVMERLRKKQASRITNLRDGDANTRFFH